MWLPVNLPITRATHACFRLAAFAKAPAPKKPESTHLIHHFL
jgi:hypothetical protein